MGFSFDSLSMESLAAAVLLAVTIWSWRMARELRARSRVHLRFAAVMLAAPAAALPVPAPGLAFNVMLLAASVACVALALASSFRQGAPPWLSAAALMAAFTTGLIASLAAMPLLALGAIFGAAASILSACPGRAKESPRAGIAAMLGAVSLILGGMAMMGGGLAEAALFFASALGLVAGALKKPVIGADARVKLLVGGKHA
jgi:hypothetical protein